MDQEFSKDIIRCERSWRNVVIAAIQNGIAVPAFAASLAYYDSYRRERLPANLTQAQRDYFGAHTFQRTDGKPGNDENGDALFVHSEWTKPNAKHNKYYGK
eukprot:UN03642